MGLEIVELVMRVEEEFSIEIPDSAAELLDTPGALCDFIAHKLGKMTGQPDFSTRSSCPTSRAFYAVRRELMQLGVERGHIAPRTPLEELWPRSQRRRNWSALSESLDADLPRLERSPEWAFVGLLPLGVLPIWLLASPTTGALFCALYALAWGLGSQITKPFAIHPPEEMRSIGDLAWRLAPRFFPVDANSSDLWPQVRHLIASQFALPLEQVTRDAHFYRDLGLG